MNIDFRFLEIPTKSCTRDDLITFMAGDEIAKRINFATTHHNSLRKTEQEGGLITLPFVDSIEPILKNKLGNDKKLFVSKYGGVWRGIHSNEEYSRFEEFIKEYNQIVFLRDNLELSLALSMNIVDEERTETGELEYLAKFQNDDAAKDDLVKICKEWLKKLPFYQYADYICAVPSSKDDSLPKRIVANIGKFDFENISDKVYWKSKTRSIKNAESTDEKLEILDESGLTISDDLNFQGKTVLLFDDLYMSGLSMQYVAMKLKEAGALRIFGLSIVKSRSNTAQ